MVGGMASGTRRPTIARASNQPTLLVKPLTLFSGDYYDIADQGGDFARMVEGEPFGGDEERVVVGAHSGQYIGIVQRVSP